MIVEGRGDEDNLKPERQYRGIKTCGRLTRGRNEGKREEERETYRETHRELGGEKVWFLLPI